ncbi:MAG: hypothetical protein ABI687_13595 [Flavitalea sp.]
MKKLKEQENKEHQNTEQKASKNEVVSSKSFFASLQVYFTDKEITRYKAYAEASVISRARSLFHPPNLI